jgi:hypothetical protein
MGLKPVFGAARYRTVDEASVIDALVFDGWRFEVAAGHADSARQAALAALDQCVTLGLPFRIDEAGRRLFDPVETTNFVKWAGITLGHDVWVRVVTTARRQLWKGRKGALRVDLPLPITAPEPRRYALTLVRTFNLSDREPGSMVRLRLPVPLQDQQLDGLSVEPRLAEGAVASSLPGGLDVRMSVPVTGSASVGLRAVFTVRHWEPGGDPELSAEDRELFTRPAEGLIRVDARIRALAESLGEGEADQLRLAGRFWAWLMEDFGFGAIHYDLIDPVHPLDWTLDHGWFDCRTGSSLLAALCRARGIPARLVSGYLLYEAAPGFHTWLEIWIEGQGWRPFDLSCWNLSAGGADPAWRDHFFGRLDHRVVTERPPRIFSGAGSVRLPEAWQMLIALERPGASVTFQALDTKALVYREDIRVERLDPPRS